MDVELRHLRYFVAVAETLNFTRAAEHLHIAQQSLSQQIRELERRLGVDLFERTTRAVRLTSAGTSLLGPARAVLAGADGFVEQAAALAAGREGSVRLVYSTSASYDTAPKLLARLRAEHPDLAVVASPMGAAQARDALLGRRADVALLRVDRPGSGLDAELVRRDPPVVLMRRDHPLAARGRLVLRDLDGQPLAMHERGDNPERYDRHLAAFRAAGVRPDARPLLLPRAAGFGELVETGCLAILGAGVAGDPPPPLVAVPLDAPELEDGHRLVWRIGEADPAVDVVRRVARGLAAAEGWLAPAPRGHAGR